MSFATELNTILTAIADNPIYTDIKKMYEDGIIDKKSYESLMVQFQQVAFSAAFSAAKEIFFSKESVEIEGKSYTAAQVDILAGFEKKKLASQQVETEKERTDLIKTQKLGFLDNRVIKLLENIRGLVAEIESGGLENPQQNWDMLYSSINALATIASEHPQIGAIAVPTTVPKGK